MLDGPPDRLQGECKRQDAPIVGDRAAAVSVPLIRRENIKVLGTVLSSNGAFSALLWRCARRVQIGPWHRPARADSTSASNDRFHGRSTSRMYAWNGQNAAFGPRADLSHAKGRFCMHHAASCCGGVAQTQTLDARSHAHRMVFSQKLWLFPSLIRATQATVQCLEVGLKVRRESGRVTRKVSPDRNPGIRRNACTHV
jgi:hypothetical protein